MKLSTPALDAWRHRGRTDVYDALASAAAWEVAGLGAHAAGQSARARDCLERAAEIVDGDGVAILAVTEGASKPSPARRDLQRALARRQAVPA